MPPEDPGSIPGISKSVPSAVRRTNVVGPSLPRPHPSPQGGHPSYLCTRCTAVNEDQHCELPCVHSPLIRGTSPVDAVMTHADGDDLVEALAAVAEVMNRSSERVAVVAARSRELLAGRAAGLSYAALVASATGPLVLDVLAELQEAVSSTGSRLRRAEVRALHAEGLSMEKIARMLRVSRQRVSAIINSPIGQGQPSDGAEHGRAAGLSLTDPEFRLIAESLPHLVWVASSEGLGEYFNRQVTDYTGLPVEATQGLKWLDVVHPDDRERARTSWERATASGTEFEMDYRLRRFDGIHRWHRARSLPVRGTQDEIVKWIGTATDIHEQLETEAELRELRLAVEELRSQT